MNLFYLLFAIAVGFLSLSLYLAYKRLESRNDKFAAQKQNTPVALIVFVALLGLFLLFSSLPGAFLDQPNWLVNKFYWVVQKVIEMFA